MNDQHLLSIYYVPGPLYAVFCTQALKRQSSSKILTMDTLPSVF